MNPAVLLKIWERATYVDCTSVFRVQRGFLSSDFIIPELSKKSTPYYFEQRGFSVPSEEYWLRMCAVEDSIAERLHILFNVPGLFKGYMSLITLPANFDDRFCDNHFIVTYAAGRLKTKLDTAVIADDNVVVIEGDSDEYLIKAALVA